MHAFHCVKDLERRCARNNGAPDGYFKEVDASREHDATTTLGVIRQWSYRLRGWAERMWRRWYEWEIRLEPVKKVTRMSKQHWDGGSSTRC